MALEEYGKKRDFKHTPEPQGALHKNYGEPLHFVIHKHQASHLHYDLRLELDGVLKSWAVPKGPSLDPHQKKLAMMVEDHPYDYRNFEGIIPEGNYGAGTVMIWDEGTYSIPGKESRSEVEEAMRTSVTKGNIFFVFHGSKLHGSFHLVKMHTKQENSWLLIKKSDEYDSTEEILIDDHSARTGRTMVEIRSQGEQSSKSKRYQLDITKLDLTGEPRVPFLGFVRPMLAQLVKEPFDRKGWFFEIKWDGYRAVAEIHRESVQLYSRNLVSFTNDYPPIIQDLKRLDFEAIFDGEIVVIDHEGRADFGRLQNYRSTKEGRLVYYIFDLLYLENYDLRQWPLHKRKALLKKILPTLPTVKYCDHVEEQGQDMFRIAKEMQIEGIMAKNSASPYISGQRSNNWQKIKAAMQQEAVVGGFTEPKGGRTNLGSLLVGVYEGNDLLYAGHVGGGFSDEDLPKVRALLQPLARPISPFKNPPKPHTDVTWLEPKMVCEIRFAEWTSEGIMRQPIFLGFRHDLEPKQVRREIAVPVPKDTAVRFVPPSDPGQKVIIEGKTLLLTNLNKVYWPYDHISKGDTIAYYRDIAPILLPHLINRPESLHRFPEGIKKEGFFQKNIDDPPEWAQTIFIESDAEEGVTNYLLCQDEATLVYMVNLGSFEINPWNSRIESLDNPDFMVIDLDPLDRSFDDVIATALTAHEILNQIKLPSFVKTSGATGIHINVPMGAQYTYEQVRQFCFLICSIIHRKLPTLTSLERLPDRRSGKVYLDFLQNTKGKTMAAPYSIRPIDGAPVSTPLTWEELKDGLHPSQFTIKTIGKRIEQFGDLWMPVLGEGINIKQSLDLLRGLY